MYLILFAIISFVSIVILIIVINDTFKTITLYFKRKATVSKNFNNTDDYSNYDNPLVLEKNELEEIESNLIIQRSNQQKHLDNIKEFKQKLDLPNTERAEANVDLRVLNDQFDDYEYDSTKDGFSFWQMLVMPPDFIQYVKKTKNAKTPYLQL